MTGPPDPAAPSFPSRAGTAEASFNRRRLRSVRRSIVAGNAANLLSPSFLIPPPAVAHAERIPPAVLAQMRPAWERAWFPPRPLGLAFLEDVFVAQKGLVLRRDGSVVAETIAQHSAAEVEAGRNAVRSLSPDRCPRLSGTVVLCRKPGAATFGHWLVELVPVAFLASQWPEPARFLMQELPDGPMPRLIRQTLDGLGIGEHARLHAGPEPVRVERLLLVEGLTSHGTYMSPLALECLRTITERVAPAGPEAIFVVRPPGYGRRLADETRVLARARRAGFAVLDPSTLSFTAQVAAFKAARRIVGVMGSAMANLAFAPEGARATILAPATMPDTFFWFIGHHRRLDLREIRCRTAFFRASDPLSTNLRLDAADADRLFDEGPAPSRPEEPLFDEDFYAETNPDLGATDPDATNPDPTELDPTELDLLNHYVETGWKQGRRPSRGFDGQAYLRAYPDVRESGLNPLLHFLRHGRVEGRKPFASARPDPASPP